MASKRSKVRKKHLRRSLRNDGGSKRSRDKDSLSIATPGSERLRFLKDEGLIAPDEISTDEDRVPLDFTRLGFRMVGAVHSRYAVRHSHAIYCAGRYRGRLVTLQRNLRITKAVKRGKLQGKFKTKWELDDALVLDDEIKKVESQIIQLEAKLTVVEALAEGYEDLRNAASREMFRRSSEQAPKD